MANLRGFWERLNRGPAVLFLGQDYLRFETGEDPLLREIEGRFGGKPTTPTYNQLLESSASDSGDSARMWISERCRRMLPPDWLESLSTFPWSSIFASAIDPIWLPVFRNEWREVAAVFDDEYFPRDPRNRRVLHSTFLFGSLDQTEPKQSAPISRFEFIARLQVARNLAQRLPDTLTPLGVLAIEGYQAYKDWFSFTDFYPILQSLEPGQVHLFSVSDELEKDEIVSELARTGKLETHPEGLAWALERGIQLGFVRPESLLDLGDGSKRVTLRHRSIPISREVWNRISNSGTLIDDRALAPPPPISKEALYWEFRRFLFESGTKPPWSGFGRGLAFRRAFEDGLHDVVLKQLGLESPTDQPIIVHGQTGTGKTVALANLAYTVAKSGAYPVIFVERRTQRPVDSDIDECCRWLEDHGAEATLIIWDGMGQQGDYHELQGYLASRGRKALVVGSSYKLNMTNDHLVEVPDRLNAEEAVQFADFLDGLGIHLTELHRDELERRDPSYLVALYRHLAPARPQITTGVIRELEQLESELLDAVRSFQPYNTGSGSLAAALLSAGLIDQSRVDQLHPETDPQIGADRIGELIDIVNVPGRFGLNIPVELLSRAWEQPDFSQIAKILRECDLFHAFEDSAGRVVVGPRHPLEAQLIVQSRIGTVQGEAAIVSRILKAMRSSAWGADENDEISFVIELLRAVGPQGNERVRFAAQFRSLSEAISEARESRNIRSPRLMLQEANLLREWVTNMSQQGNRPEETSEVLGQAQSILRDALDLLMDNPRQWRLRTFIATELASTLGSATVDSINIGASNRVVQESFEQVLDAVQAARSIDVSTYSPVDVLVWSTLALSQPGIVDENIRTEAIVDALDALETVDEDLLDGRNREQFHRRRFEIGELLGNQDLSESAFQSLIAIGSSAGFYIRAREIAQGIHVPAGRGSKDGESYRAAWEYLENNRDHITNDARCLNLLLNNWWISKTGHRLFDDERVVLPFRDDEWSYTLQLVRELRALESHRDLALSLLEAIALFHMGRFPAALHLFREVEAESYRVPGRRRIFRSFLASEAGGSPKAYHGTVRHVEPRGHRAQVFVDEIGQHLTLLPADFGRPDIRQGDSLGEFHIAFNFIGPILDPLARFKV